MHDGKGVFWRTDRYVWHTDKDVRSITEVLSCSERTTELIEEQDKIRMSVNKPPLVKQHHSPLRDPVVNIATAILLTIITCGIYGLFWQYRQMSALNGFLGRKEYDFWMWFLLSIITCGIFAMYYEYKMANGLNEIKEARGRRVDANLPLICLLLTVFGLGIVSLAIEQNEINGLCNVSADF